MLKLNPQRADMIGDDCERLPLGEVTELQNQLNVNAMDAEDNGETWLDEEIPVACVSIIDEDEFFQRYFGEQL